MKCTVIVEDIVSGEMAGERSVRKTIMIERGFSEITRNNVGSVKD